MSCSFRCPSTRHRQSWFNKWWWWWWWFNKIHWLNEVEFQFLVNFIHVFYFVANWCNSCSLKCFHRISPKLRLITIAFQSSAIAWVTSSNIVCNCRNLRWKLQSVSYTSSSVFMTHNSFSRSGLNFIHDLPTRLRKKYMNEIICVEASASAFRERLQDVMLLKIWVALKL